MGGEVFTDFKSSNRIEISRLVQVLLNFDWFRGSPTPEGGGWVDGGGGWWQGLPPTRAHTHACRHTHAAHARPRTYDIIGNPWDFPKSDGGSHLHGIIMFTTHACVCVCVCVHARACAHVWGAPQFTPHPHPPSPPIPRAAGSPKHQNSISLELIEIIRFCLKILYRWTFLNSYRL